MGSVDRIGNVLVDHLKDAFEVLDRITGAKSVVIHNMNTEIYFLWII